METEGESDVDVLESARAAMFSPRRADVRGGGGSGAPEPDAVLDLDGDGTALVWGSTPSPYLVVHGWEGSSHQFGPFVGRLRALGSSVVGVDAPGHGRGPDVPFSSVRHARGLIRAQDRFGPFAGVVAHSLGAVAAHVARREGLVTRSLVLLAPVRSMSEQVTGLADRLRVDPTRRPEFDAMVHDGLGRSVHDLDLDACAAPSCPVLICHDRDDRKVPVASSRALARAWSAAELRETSGLRHHGILADPDTVARAVDHLRAAPGEASCP